MSFEPRRIGTVQASNGRHVRVVSQFVEHGPPISFSELADRVIRPDTRYLVLDLDRTTHLGRNLGELLGWELCAHLAYGPDRLATLESKRSGRFCFDWNDPIALVRYLLLGMRLWAYPGLYYLTWGKISARLDALRRRAYRRFGPEPIRAVQQIPQTALFHQLSSLPLDTLRVLSERVWDRCRRDQVIEREDLDRIRARCPDIKIVISSASPLPMVEVAARKLGADAFIASAIDQHDGYLSAPFGGHRLLKIEREPRRLSPPSQLRINASFAKIEHLIQRFPDFADPSIEKVGMTDNGYGEDQCWAEFFSVVVDVNSRTPFSPIVTTKSPLREVHSAHVLTRAAKAAIAHAAQVQAQTQVQAQEQEQAQAEMQEQMRGQLQEQVHEQRQEQVLAQTQPPVAGPSRRRMASESETTEEHAWRREERTWDSAALSASLGQILDDIEELASRYRARATSLAASIARLTEQTGVLHQAIEEEVEEYNRSEGRARTKILVQLRRHLAEELSLKRQVARIERPLSELAYHLAKRLEDARAKVESIESLDARASSKAY